MESALERSRLFYCLKFFLYYILTCGLLLLIITFVYAQYLSSTHAVVGSSAGTVTTALVVYAFFKATPIVLCFAPLALIIFRLRHDEAHLISILFFIILVAINFLILLPITERTYEKLIRRIDITDFEIGYNDNIPLTGGFFRTTDHCIYYFLGEERNGRAKVIELYNDGHERVRYGYRHLTADQIRYPRFLWVAVGSDSFYILEASPFRDIIFKESLELSHSEKNTVSESIMRHLNPTLYAVMDFFEIPLFSMRKLHALGPRGWLVFLSFAFSLSAVYAWTKLSSFRFINFLNCMLVYFIIFWFNGFYFTKLFSPIRVWLERKFNHFPFVHSLIFTDLSAPLFFINIAVGLFIIIFGVIMTSRWRKMESVG